ncbi:MAG: DUF2603 domain-containing protein [Helicobacter sp.]|nr:DUF2603 domain-containing protein [Helicobacter sp.]
MSDVKELFSEKIFGKLQYLDDTTAQITMQNGAISKEEVCFLKDDENNEYALLPQHILKDVIKIIKRAHEMRLQAELERDIISLMPLDFDDVLSVAKEQISQIRDKNGVWVKINTRELTKKIKKDYPNLF